MANGAKKTTVDVAFLSPRRTIHSVNDFTEILKEVVSLPPYNGSMRALAKAIAVDHTHLSRVLSGDREFSPQVVGRIARLLPDAQAQELIKQYLRKTADEIAQHHGKAAVKIR